MNEGGRKGQIKGGGEGSQEETKLEMPGKEEAGNTEQLGSRE